MDLISSYFQEQEFDEVIIYINNNEIIESGNINYSPENLIDLFFFVKIIIINMKKIIKMNTKKSFKILYIFFQFKIIS